MKEFFVTRPRKQLILQSRETAQKKSAKDFNNGVTETETLLNMVYTFPTDSRQPTFRILLYCFILTTLSYKNIHLLTLQQLKQ